MKVRELIAALMEQDPDADVMVYSLTDEGASWANGILASVRGSLDDRPYVKGDWPDVGARKAKPIVIIR